MDYKKIAEALEVLNQEGIGDPTLNSTFRKVFEKVASMQDKVNCLQQELDSIKGLMTDASNDISRIKHRYQ